MGSARTGACLGPGDMVGPSDAVTETPLERLLCVNVAGGETVLYRPTWLVLHGDTCDFTCPPGLQGTGSRFSCYHGDLHASAACIVPSITTIAVDHAAAAATAAATEALADVCKPFGGPGVAAVASEQTPGDPLLVWAALAAEETVGRYLIFISYQSKD